jgi:acetoacetyl-CoA synthase
MAAGGLHACRAALCLAILRGPDPRVIVAAAQESAVRIVPPHPHHAQRYARRELWLEGSRAHPQPDVLWQVAQDAQVSFFGASPAYVDLMSRAGIVPGKTFDLSRLRSIMLAGSPVSAACGAWFYRNVSTDLWLCSGSGGTDVCSGFVGGVATQPVYAGEIQGRHPGVATYAFNERGEPVTDEVGEMVITEPMPSMPAGFWGDHDGSRYRETYFADFPGVWRQGDFFRVNRRGGCFVLGRSDATLNRHGVRIGTAEIYAVVAGIPEIEDALIVNLDLPGGGFFMPLFVTLAGGRVLDDTLEEVIRDRLRREYTPPRAGPDHPGPADPGHADRQEGGGPGAPDPARDGTRGRGQRQRDGQPGRPGRVHQLRPDPAGLPGERAVR